MEKETQTKSGTEKGLSPNMAAALSYVFGLISGIIFFLLSKDKNVKFHAMQSIILSVAFFVIRVVFMMMFFSSNLQSIFGLLYVALSVVLIIKAYKGERYKLPLIGDWAEKYSHSK
jgi:uncharacterized membrane protein